MTSALRLSLLLVLAVLAGCSSDGSLQALRGDLGARLLPFWITTPDDPTYRALAHEGAPTLPLAVQGQPEILLRRHGASADGTQSYIAPDGTGYRFRQGLIVAVRGASGGLMSADVSQILPALRHGTPSQKERFHSYLDGDNGIVTRAYVCSVTPQPGRPEMVIEACTGAEESFTNRYELSADGAIVASLQTPDPRQPSVQVGGPM